MSNIPAKEFLSLSFVSSLVAEGPAGIKEARNHGFKSEYLVGPGRDVFDFIAEYAQKFGAVPDPSLIKGRTGLSILEPTGKAAFFASELVRLERVEGFQDALGAAAKFLSENPNPDKVEQILQQALSKARSLKPNGIKIESMNSYGPAYTKFYEDRKAGVMGIPYPWKTMNKGTSGMWPQNLILWVARLGVGKCLSADALITDPVTGVPHTIEQVYNSNTLLDTHTWDGTCIKSVPITAKVDTGHKQCIRITLCSGRVVVLTPEHPLMSSTGWKRADLFAVGESIAVPNKLPEPLCPVSVSPEVLQALVEATINGAVVPEAVFRLSNNQLQSFLYAFTNSGQDWSYSYTGLRDFEAQQLSPSMVGLSETVARQLQSLYLRLGTCTKIAPKYNTPDGSWRLGWVCQSSDVMGADEIVSIEDAGMCKIYDLTVEPTACFIANDILVHNTFTMINQAIVAHRAGYRVLVVTVEMTPEEISQRYFNMLLKENPTQYLQGQFPKHIEDKMYALVQDLMAKDDNRLRIASGEFEFSMTAVSDAVDDFLPDIVIIDGAYLLDPEVKTEAKRTERVAQVFNEIKLLAVQKNIPVVVSTQFNRDAAKNGKAGADAANIGLTDVAGQHATVAMALVQDEAQKQNNQMSMKQLKVRNGSFPDFDCNWDISKMNFDELPGKWDNGGIPTNPLAQGPSDNGPMFGSSNSDDF